MGQTLCFSNTCKDCNATQPNGNMILPRIKMYSASRIGRALHKINCQDKVYCLQEFAEDCHFATVFDGFGPYGREVAEFVAAYMISEIQRNKLRFLTITSDLDIKYLMQDIIKDIDQALRKGKIDCSVSGTCFLGVFLIRNRYFAINIGNCKSEIHRGDPFAIESLDLNCTQDVSNEFEQKRIASMISKIGKSNMDDGTEVGAERFWLGNSSPGLKVTRAFGGYEYKQILIPEPEITSQEMNFFDKYIVLGTDGLWDVMTSSEVSQVLYAHTEEEDDNLAETLVKDASRRWDEICKRPKNCFIGIGDDPQARTGADDIAVAVISLRFGLPGGVENSI